MQELILRTKPELKIILYQDRFEVIDAYTPENNGTYSFKSIQQIKLNQSRTNWFISIFNTLLYFLLGLIDATRYKDKAHLLIRLNDKSLKVLLHHADLSKAKEVTTYIKKMIN